MQCLFANFMDACVPSMAERSGVEVIREGRGFYFDPHSLLFENHSPLKTSLNVARLLSGPSHLSVSVHRSVPCFNSLTLFFPICTLLKGMNCLSQSSIPPQLPPICVHPQALLLYFEC